MSWYKILNLYKYNYSQVKVKSEVLLSSNLIHSVDFSRASSGGMEVDDAMKGSNPE